MVRRTEYLPIYFPPRSQNHQSQPPSTSTIPKSSFSRMLFKMHFITLALTSLLFSLTSSLSVPTFTQPHFLSARSDSSPNPIATLYPNNVTGTINGTIAIVPISYQLARSIIPAKYGILREAYENQLPGFPGDSYPVLSPIHF